MRHRVATKSFNRDTKARAALLKGLVRSLVEQGSITTTLAKAKEVRRLADKIISKAKDGSVATRRTLHTFFGKRDVVNTLVERVAPQLTTRTSGFTRIVKLGSRRGDNTDMATLSLVSMPEQVGLRKASVQVKSDAKADASQTKKAKSTEAAPKAGAAVAAPKVQKIAATRAGSAKRTQLVRKTGER